MNINNSIWVLCVLFHSTKQHFTGSGACRDKVSMCYTYDPIICVVYRSWAEVQCACFCKTHNHGLSAAPNQAILTPPTIRTSHHVTPPTIRTPHFLTPSTSPYHVTNSVPSSISCFTCEDYLTFRCKSFATECVNTCMIRYRDGKLESKCTMDLECRNSQQNEFLHFGSSTRCCRTNDCVTETIQQAIRNHQTQTGSQSSSAVAMSSSSATQPLPVTTKPATESTTTSTTGTTLKSTTVRTTLKTTPVKSTSYKSTVDSKTSSSPVATSTAKTWSFVTIPIGRRRRLINTKT
nr:uncharacterized protein PB18E9.04c-like isoform X1 [Crassostrea gigas]